MSKIVLKTAKRSTSVSRAAVRSAVSGRFVSASYVVKPRGASARKRSVGKVSSRRK